MGTLLESGRSWTIPSKVSEEQRSIDSHLLSRLTRDPTQQQWIVRATTGNGLIHCKGQDEALQTIKAVFQVRSPAVWPLDHWLSSCLGSYLWQIESIDYSRTWLFGRRRSSVRSLHCQRWWWWLHSTPTDSIRPISAGCLWSMSILDFETTVFYSTSHCWTHSSMFSNHSSSLRLSSVDSRHKLQSNLFTGLSGDIRRARSGSSLISLRTGRLSSIRTRSVLGTDHSLDQQETSCSLREHDDLVHEDIGDDSEQDLSDSCEEQ